MTGKSTGFLSEGEALVAALADAERKKRMALFDSLPKIVRDACNQCPAENIEEWAADELFWGRSALSVAREICAFKPRSPED